jgi:hypothetical protein
VKTPGSRKELSAAQHRWIRRQLLLLPAYIWTPYVWSVFIDQLPIERSRTTAQLFRDFLHFYILGLLVRVKAASLLYDPDAQRRLLQQVVPSAPDLLIPTSWGPQAGFVFAPISGGSYVQALMWWLAISIVGYVLCIYALWRMCPNLRRESWPVIVLALALPALHANLMYAQTGTLELAWAILFYTALRDPKSPTHQLTNSPTRQLAAGFALGLLFVKPHLGVGAAVLVMSAGQWLVAAGAVVTIVAQLAVSAAYWGPHILVDYGQALLRIPGTFAVIEPDLRQMHEWRAFFELVGLEHGLLNMATLAAAALTLGVGVVCWRRRGDLRLRYAVLLMCTLMISPHAYAYDMMLLVPGGMLVWDWLSEHQSDRERSPRTVVLELLLALGYVSPVIGLAGKVLHFQPSLLIFSALGFVLMSCLTEEVQQTEDFA